jgi:hypothetical protein
LPSLWLLLLAGPNNVKALERHPSLVSSLGVLQLHGKRGMEIHTNSTYDNDTDVLALEENINL